MKPALLGLLLGAAMITSTLTAAPEARADTTDVNDRPMLELIGYYEGPRGYDDIFRKATIRPPMPLTQMTIGEVMAFQNRMVAAGSESSAVGRYQFIRKTLKRLVDNSELPHDALFDRNVQDYLARLLMAECEFYTPQEHELEIANCLAQVWAAFPVATGKKAGRSYYDGIAGNRALVDVGTVVRTINRRFARSGEIVISMR